MIGVLEGFAVIGVVIVIGYLIGRRDLLGEAGRTVWNRTVFFVALPCLLFALLGSADPTDLLSPIVIIVMTAALVTAAVSVLIGRFVFHRSLGQLVVAAMGSAYLNSQNIGLPVAVYVLGNATAVAPIIVMQLVFFVPPLMVFLERALLGEKASVRSTLRSAVRNPLFAASVAGTALCLSRVPVPAVVFAPLRLVGDAAVPLMLMSFGMSLAGARVLQRGSGRGDVVITSLLKVVFMPAVAWVVATALRQDDMLVRYSVVLAGLPAAQNVANYADHYGFFVSGARDVVLMTTLGAVPVLLAVSLLLGR